MIGDRKYDILGAAEKAFQLENEIYVELRRVLGEKVDGLKKIADMVARL